MFAGRRWAAWATALLAAGATWVAGARLERLGESPAVDALLYLPNGKHLKVLSLGHESLLADAVYLWAIQYYSNYSRAERYRYVDHVFREVITELDPQYVDAYWLGALILIVEAREVEAGLRLLDKGIEHNPGEWILPYLAAWESHNAGLFDRAERYFERAARVRDAPPVVRRMRAGMRGKAGDVAGALGLWNKIIDDPESDARSVAIARRQVRELAVRRDIALLNEAIERFRIENDRLPGSLEEMRQRAYIDAVPRDPSGQPYRYDPAAGGVAPPGGRVLGPE